MVEKLQLKFDPNQDFQLEAIHAVTDLFKGLSPQAAVAGLSTEIVSNMPSEQGFGESWLRDNLAAVQELHSIPKDGLFRDIKYDEGMEVEDVSSDTHRAPHFTIEMETGTGKTYVYIRTLYELHKLYGFRKFIIVVPSIAIYEGVLKTFEITAAHFRALYDGTLLPATAYDGAQLSKLRGFATNTMPQCLIMTIDAFNKKTNNFYKASEKLPGERKPYQFVQETRPIVILDEPQNMESDRAKMAIRTLHPLFVLRYSATHRTSPNLIYRLTPFEAFRRGLVKRIEVDAVTEREDFNQPFLMLRSVASTPRITATVRTYVTEGGRTRVTDVVLGKEDDLHAKTGRDEHEGYVVSEINAAYEYVEFANSVRLTLNDTIGASRPEIFRTQIRRTIEQHMLRQHELSAQGVKVLSLFFIDRVANYTAADGLIRRLFDEEFDRLKKRFPHFAERQAGEVREAYFAKTKQKDGAEVAVDTEGRNEDERKAEKSAFELIMRKKEQLLRLEEPVAFIFAHSALKEGWDNPNVFQICTLNQTVSEVKKRQEIGRGLRLCVDQQGERIFGDEINTLTVVANESYDTYVSGLQREYQVDGLTEVPPPPTKARTSEARRNEAHFQSADFRAFWEKLSRRTRYHVHIDSDLLVERCIEKLNNAQYPLPMVVVERGRYVVTKFTLVLKAIHGTQVTIAFSAVNTNDEKVSREEKYKKGDDLAKRIGDARLRGYKIMEIKTGSIVFENSAELWLNNPLEFESEAMGQRPTERATLIPEKPYPVFNLLERAARETGLTRPTLNRIFRGLSEHTKLKILKNPEGFSAVFITTVHGMLADHIADRITFEVLPDVTGYDLDELFPPTRRHPQKELLDAGEQGLYNKVQKDSDVEVRFVEQRLKPDDQVILFFKFPPAFKVSLPRILGNYNPDWGIVRRSEGDKLTLHLVRETKGDPDKTKLQYPHEARKITSAEKHFAAMGIDYRHITAETLDWWQSAAYKQEKLTGLEKE
ncbi:MAG: DEAD/DEAH box helicase family protein [Anaerolinea sp.]|nr:DEAD/DEAH box helicase family protein [Anaerolinea sp.]